MIAFFDIISKTSISIYHILIPGKNRTFVRRDLLHLMDIRYYNNSRPIIPNPCSIINGGCSHLCLLSPISDETNRLHGAPSYSCACPTGLVLGSDKRTCNTNMNK